jgi:hypothetical protein
LKTTPPSILTSNKTFPRCASATLSLVVLV